MVAQFIINAENRCEPGDSVRGTAQRETRSHRAGTHSERFDSNVVEFGAFKTRLCTSLKVIAELERIQAEPRRGAAGTDVNINSRSIDCRRHATAADIFGDQQRSLRPSLGTSRQRSDAARIIRRCRAVGSIQSHRDLAAAPFSLARWPFCSTEIRTAADWSICSAFSFAQAI